MKIRYITFELKEEEKRKIIEIGKRKGFETFAGFSRVLFLALKKEDIEKTSGAFFEEEVFFNNSLKKEVVRYREDYEGQRIKNKYDKLKTKRLIPHGYRGRILGLSIYNKAKEVAER